MNKSIINILALMFTSWALYGLCQRDLLLPALSAGIILFSFILRSKTLDKEYAFFQQLPLPAIIIISFLAGMIWRNVVPIPEDANAPLLKLTSALQSAAIVAGTLLALRPLSKRTLYSLGFCSWLTAAVSINVPFTQDMLMVFAAFALIGLSIVIIATMHAPSTKKYTLLYARDYIVFACLMMLLTIGFFLLFSRSIVAMETAFYNTMGNYIMPRNYTNFLNISPTLNLINPGLSAADKRPVIQVSMDKESAVYLKMQVFDEYYNGTWKQVKDVSKTPLTKTLPLGEPHGTLVMFRPLKDIVPAPQGITAVKGRTSYFKDQDGIIYADGPLQSHILEFSWEQSASLNTTLSPQDYARYTALPDTLAPRLRDIARSITFSKGDAYAKTRKITEYFHRNFCYSLDVNFSADDKGLMKMLEQKRPAYCTYFASALTLLLRAEGIPARMAAGFLTTERIDKSRNIFLARVRNAHAWTEVLLPVYDPRSKTTTPQWTIFDATPPSFQKLLGPKTLSDHLELAFERMWIGLLHLKALFENADKEQMKINGILILIAVMALINHRKITALLKSWFKKRPATVRYKAPGELEAIYKRYESWLKSNFQETRRTSDTDLEVIERIKRNFPKRPTEGMEDFIRAYHAARFGLKEGPDLGSLLKKLNVSDSLSDFHGRDERS